MPLHSDVHIDRPLSNFMQAYKPFGLIAQDIVPWVTVNNKSDSYVTFEQKDGFTLPETIRGPKDTANEVDWSTGSDNYACIDHALRNFLPDAIVGNSDPGIDPRRRTSEQLTDLLLLAYERVIATLVTTAGSFGGAYKDTLSGGDQWSAYATSDPLANVETGRQAMFVPPNVMLISDEVWAQLKFHPQIISKISGGATTMNPALVTRQLVAEAFEVDRLLVGVAKYNTANKGQNSSFSRVWGKFCLLAFVQEAASLDDVSAFKSFRWNQLSTDAVYQVRTYRDESKGGGGEWIEVETSYDEKIVASDTAYLLSTVVS